MFSLTHLCVTNIYLFLAGLAILVLCLPLNAINFYYMEKLQKKQMKHKDMRVKLLNEILSGIKVLKMYAWEKSFIQKIGDIRKIEVDALKWVQVTYCHYKIEESGTIRVFS